MELRAGGDRLEGLYIAGDVDGTSHYDDFFDSEEGLGVFGGGESEVGEWPDRYDGDGVDWVVL